MKKFLLIALLATTALFGATESELQRAYAKEFAFLKAQKRMLEQRLDQIKIEGAHKISAAKSDITKLQNRVIELGIKVDSANEALFQAQQTSQSITDDTSMIESVVLQATSTLKPYGVDVNVDNSNYPATLSMLFSESLKLTRKLSSVHNEEGTFYLPDGTKKEGTLVKIGNIGVYGVAGSTAGVLVPAGGGELKLWDKPETAPLATALAQNQIPQTLSLFMFENIGSEVQDIVEKTALDVIDSAGIIGWVIVGLGLFALLLIALRVGFLSASGAKTAPLTSGTITKIKEEGLENALEFLQTKKGAAARVMKATVRNLDRDREHIEDIISETVLHESGRLDRYASVILVIAAVAPLLGLLGTVTGMIATFDIITEFGTGDPKLLSGGISIALVTTELGLIVAIPLLLLGNLLNGWAERIKDDMEQSALHIINEYNKLK